MPSASERSLIVRELVTDVFEIAGLLAVAAAIALAAAGCLAVAAGCGAGGAALIGEALLLEHVARPASTQDEAA